MTRAEPRDASTDTEDQDHNELEDDELGDDELEDDELERRRASRSLRKTGALEPRKGSRPVGRFVS